MQRIEVAMLAALILATGPAAAQGIPGRTTVEELMRRDSEKALMTSQSPVVPSLGTSLVVPNLGITVPAIATTPTPPAEPPVDPLIVTAIYGFAPTYTVDILASGKPFKLTVGRTTPPGSPYTLVSVSGKCATFTRAKAKETASYATRVSNQGGSSQKGGD